MTTHVEKKRFIPRRTPQLLPVSSQVRLHVRVAIPPSLVSKSPSLPQLKKASSTKKISELTVSDLLKPLPLHLRAQLGKQLGYNFGLRLALYAAKICGNFTGSAKQLQVLRNFCAREANLIPTATRAQNLNNDNAEKRLIVLHKTGHGRLYSNDLDHIYYGYLQIAKNWEPVEEAIPGYISVMKEIYACLDNHKDLDKKTIFDLRLFNRLSR